MISGNNLTLSRPENLAHPVNLLCMGKLIFFATLFFAGWAAIPAYAQESEKDAPTWNITELMHNLAQVKKSQATFVEHKFISLLKAPLKYSGTLSYTAPGHLEKYTLLPKPESMVLDKNTLIVQSGEAQKRALTLQNYPALWAFIESIRSTLAGDITTLNRFYHVILEGHSEQWLLILRPVDTQTKNLVNEIRISGSLEQINTIETREAGGDYSVMNIRKDDS